MADGSIKLDTEIDESGLKTGLANLGTKTLSGITKAITAAGTALVGLGTFAVKTGSAFETAFAGTSTMFGDVEVDVESLKGSILDLSSQAGISATDITASLYNALSAGVPVTEDMTGAMEFMEQSVKLAAAGFTDVDTAVTATAKVMNAYGMSLDDVDAIQKMMLQTQNKGITTVGELGQSLAQVTPVAAAMGVGFDNVSAGLATMTAAGTPTAQATTQLKSLFAELGKEGTKGAEALKAAAAGTEYAGMSFTDMMNAGVPLNTVLDLMSGYADDSGLSMIDLFSSIEAGNAALSLSGEHSATFTENLAAMHTELDVVGDAYDKVTDTFEYDVKRLQTGAQNFGNAVYEEMEEPLRDFAQEGTKLLGELKTAVDEGGLSGLASAVGSVLAEAVTYISDYIPQFIQGGVQLIEGLVQGLIDSAPVLAGAAVQAGMALLEGILSIATQLVVLGGELIIALCDGIASNAPQIMQTAMEGLLQFTEAVVTYLPLVVQSGIEMLGALAQGLLEAIPTLLAALPTIVQSLVDGILATVETFIQTATSLVEGIVAALPQIILALIAALPQIVTSICEGLLALIDMVVTAGVQLLTALIQALPEIIVTICQALPQIITEIVGTLLGMIPQIIDCGVQLLVSLVQALPDIIYAIVLVLPQIIAAIISTLVGMIPQLIQCGIQLLVSLVSALPQIIIAIVAVLPQIISSIIQALLANIPLLIQCGVQLLTSLIGALPQIITTIVMALPQIISSIIQAILSNIPLIVQAGIQLFVALIQALPQIIATIVQSIPQIGSSLVQAITGLIPSMVSAGFNLLRGLATGIGNAVSSVVQSAAAACRSVFDRVKSFFGIASPSKLFRDVVGKNLMLGLTEGIEDETNTAVDAVQDAADDIANVDFGVDYSRLVSMGKEAVLSQGLSTGTSITAGSASSVYGSSAPDTVADKSPTNPQYVENNIYFDGKKTARIITPYISKELAWEGE